VRQFGETRAPRVAARPRVAAQDLRGLERASALACVSTATHADARRLLNGYRGELIVLPNALNYPYRVLPREETAARLRAVPALAPGAPYVLHVGSNLRRKNRECVLRALAAAAPHWLGVAAFAGQPLSGELRALAAELGVARRVVEVAAPTNELLEALYNGAVALLFPSRFEGFGWPIVEAQAAGCPVICSDRAPLPEVAGDAAVLCDADDHAAIVAPRAALATSSRARRAARARFAECGALWPRRMDRQARRALSSARGTLMRHCRGRCSCRCRGAARPR
jgi:glycosyltransferase involved in cell wall biosynthesis